MCVEAKDKGVKVIQNKYTSFEVILVLSIVIQKCIYLLYLLYEIVLGYMNL